MTFTLAHLGPAGTYAEQAAHTYAQWWTTQTQQPPPQLVPLASIAQTLFAVAQGHIDVAVAPVENSIEGSVTTTLDALWQLDALQIQQALILPITHVLVSQATDLRSIEAVYSHPQALGQCQQWLQRQIPQAQLIPTHSTTEALQHIRDQQAVAAIASEQAAQLYQLPIQARSIQDYADNCTRFLVVSRPDSTLSLPPISTGQDYISLAFSLLKNVPGALVTPLQIFAERHINLSRIESRPTKRSLGDYVFFVDAEANLDNDAMQSALQLLKQYTERLKLLGAYRILHIAPAPVREEC
jgi:prephenate dehydratase